MFNYFLKQLQNEIICTYKNYPPSPVTGHEEQYI